MSSSDYKYTIERGWSGKYIRFQCRGSTNELRPIFKTTVSITLLSERHQILKFRILIRRLKPGRH